MIAGIKNPILPGFNPDPSIIRVGMDYYIATSTFEWFPGVQIHHSTDLANWTLMTHPLDTVEKLDMRGAPDSCGVWAPCLSYHRGIFYLVYSNVKSFNGMDTPNYLVTARNIKGPWSKPIYLASYGFDGSLFHDDDGRHWYLSLLVDHRAGRMFGGIVMQEYSAQEKKLVGSVHKIFEGSKLGLTEGPHIYKREGYYYLLTAEGGTEYGHAVSIARSKKLEGPYALHPKNPLASARKDKKYPLQKLGHGDFVWTSQKECYLVCLTGRPLSEHGRCTLGRETVIEKVIWKNGWPYLESGKKTVRTVVPVEGVESDRRPQFEKIDFKKDRLSLHYQSLRVPQNKSWINYTDRKNHLRLYGRDSLVSSMDQSLVARRVQSFNIDYTISIDCSPIHHQHRAGLVCYYNTGHHYYLHLSCDDANQKTLNLVRRNNFEYDELVKPIKLSKKGACYLKCKWHREKLTFHYSLDNKQWVQVGIIYDGSILSDDYVRDGSDRYKPAFTGSFVGIACQDFSGQGWYADYRWLVYLENE